MPFAPFYELFPEVARAETRSITVLKAGSALPAGTYGFVEMFCNDERCDCRRAFIQVLADVSPRLRDNRPMATISFGWEDESFYRKWASFPLSNEGLAELKGPALASMAPQSRYPRSFSCSSRSSFTMKPTWSGSRVTTARTVRSLIAAARKPT